MANPRVFISYSWDSDAHRAWALMLADRLVENGVDVQFDQYDAQLEGDTTPKMELNISEVDFVIIILTENYKKKVEGSLGGGDDEISLISADWYNNEANKSKCIHVLRSGGSDTAIPDFMKRDFNSDLISDIREDKDFKKEFRNVMQTIKPPRVFISYSWDSPTHRAWVLMLADRLVENGVDVQFDQYDIKLGRNITQKMELNISEVDFVIIVLTENYKKKADGRIGGVGFEYSMISAEWYRNQSNNTKFIPVLRSGSSDDSIPTFMKNYLYANMREGEEFELALEKVLRTIYDEPSIPQPPIGKKPKFEQNKRSYTPSSKNISESSHVIIENNTNKMNQLDEVKKKLKPLMRADDLEGALNVLGDYAEEQGNNSLESDVTLLFSRLNSLKKQTTQGLIGTEQATMMRNRLQHAVVATINGLK